jgi:hypothetical protein
MPPVYLGHANYLHILPINNHETISEGIYKAPYLHAPSERYSPSFLDVVISLQRLLTGPTTPKPLWRRKTRRTQPRAGLGKSVRSQPFYRLLTLPTHTTRLP